ncbi:substrate-binding domain-containing protein, partial [Rhizobium ruizarguesonis]
TEAGLPNPLHYVRLGATDQQQTDGVIERLLSDGAPPTALLASDSLVGLRIFKSLQSLGLSIPKDVSMISFLDADWTSVTVPPITIADHDPDDAG